MNNLGFLKNLVIFIVMKFKNFCFCFEFVFIIFVYLFNDFILIFVIKLFICLFNCLGLYVDKFILSFLCIYL